MENLKQNILNGKLNKTLFCYLKQKNYEYWLYFKQCAMVISLGISSNKAPLEDQFTA